MQCPNCKKEALNVNGRYVCLDCGIEITSAGTPASYSQKTAPEPNNGSPQAGESPGNAPAPSQDQKPEPVSVEQPPVTAPSAMATGQEISGSDVSGPTDQPVKKYFESTISEAASQSPNQTAKNSPVIPDFPISENSDSITKTQPENNNTQAELNIPIPENSDLLGSTQNQSFFQPQKAEITPSGQMPSPAKPPVEDTPPVPEVPKAEDEIPVTLPNSDSNNNATSSTLNITPAAENIPATAVPTEPQPQNVQPSPPVGSTNNPPLDTVVSSEPTVVLPPEEPTPILKEDPTIAPIPGASNIPSAEMVFGEQFSEQKEELMKQRGSGMKQFLRLFGVIILTFAIIAGVVWGIMYYLNMNKAKPPVVDSGQTLKTTQAVAGVMDAAPEVSSNFEQTIDFSKVTLNPTIQNENIKKDLTSYFSATQALKGNWSVNGDDDKIFEIEANGKKDKRLYIAGEDLTYTFYPETNTWIKTPGMQIVNVPYAFPLDQKGSFFYSRKIANLGDQTSEVIAGTSLTKMKINPKSDAIAELMTSANLKLFSDIKYETIDTNNLSFYAWLDSENRVVRLEISGDILVKSNYYQGTVTVNISGDYSYNPVAIAKPL